MGDNPLWGARNFRFGIRNSEVADRMSDIECQMSNVEWGMTFEFQISDSNSEFRIPNSPLILLPIFHHPPPVEEDHASRPIRR